MRSLITDYDIYCSNTKISSFGMGYFIGGVVGLLVLPEFLKYFFHIELVIYSSIICIICNIFLLFVTNYYAGIFIFTVSMTARNVLQVPAFQYTVEMVRSGERAIVIGLVISMIFFSGLILNLMEIIVGDYKGEIISNTLLFIISVILVKLLLIDSSSNTFVRGNYKKIVNDLKYVATINGSEKDYKVWIEKIYEDSKTDISEELMYSKDDKTNKYDLVNYFSIWSLKGITSKLLIFILFVFTIQFNFIFLFYEVKKVGNFFTISSICYVMDIIGSMFGAFIIDRPMFGRRRSSIIINVVAGFSYFLTGIVLIYTGNMYLILLNRFLNASLSIIVYTYAFECFPTVLRTHASSIVGISGRIMNLPTPLLMINYPIVSYFVIGALDIVLAICIFFCNIGETRGIQTEELPEEFKDPEFLKKMQIKKE